MNGKDVFGVIIRTFGLLLLLSALWFLANLTGYEIGSPLGIRSLFLRGVVQPLVGLYLLRGAPGLIDFSYPSGRNGERKNPKSKPEDPDAW